MSEYKTDIEIAREAKLQPIKAVAAGLGITEDELELYGKYKAKITDGFLARIAGNRPGKLILVTAINPTPAGEGKTTTTVGLGQAFGRLGKKAIVALREPSLGPCFGMKGGAAGGGLAQVVPMEDLNLHFTGDFHAITTANNLLAALLDNHIQQGNELRIDPRNVVWKRCLDMNDRVLRNTVIGLGNKSDGTVREDHFVITVASEIMAVLCLAADMADLKIRLGRMVVAYNYDGNPVTADELQAVGAMAALLKDAIKPNLVQTLENTPALVHGGPFANIAHGCNSVRATAAALKMADYCITEAGFGADLGAEKFFDIKCRSTGFKPDAVVLVATVRALKYNGGWSKTDQAKADLDKADQAKADLDKADQAKADLVKADLVKADQAKADLDKADLDKVDPAKADPAKADEDGGKLETLKKGIVNLGKHIENIRKYKVPVIVALNSFVTDTAAEVAFVAEYCKDQGCGFALSQVWEQGGAGGIALAEKVLEILAAETADFQCLYDDGLSLQEKITCVAKDIYGAAGVEFADAAANQMKKLEQLGFGRLPVCMAKTQYSLSDNPQLLGRPANFALHVREMYVSAGAGFVVVLTGAVMTMPGLPKKPAAFDIDVDEKGMITGLF